MTHHIEEGYWSLVEPVWLALNRSWDDGCEEFVRLFKAVRPEIGHLYAGHWCQSEICNGGFYQFFHNTTGLLAPEALEGYRAIGLAELAESLATAMKFFGSPYPRERADRQQLMPPWLRAFGKKEFHVVRNPRQISEHANRRKAS
jgi:hypothetical protein